LKPRPCERSALTAEVDLLASAGSGLLRARHIRRSQSPSYLSRFTVSLAFCLSRGGCTPEHEQERRLLHCPCSHRGHLGGAARAPEASPARWIELARRLVEKLAGPPPHWPPDREGIPSRLGG
jgi:hypothetical protein